MSKNIRTFVEMKAERLESGVEYWIVRSDSRVMNSEIEDLIQSAVYQGPLIRTQSDAVNRQKGFIFSIYQDKSVILVWETELLAVFELEEEAYLHLGGWVNSKLKLIEKMAEKSRKQIAV